MATQQYHACVQGTVTLFFAHAQRLTNKTFDKATQTTLKTRQKFLLCVCVGGGGGGGG